MVDSIFEISILERDVVGICRRGDGGGGAMRMYAVESDFEHRILFILSTIYGRRGAII